MRKFTTIFLSLTAWLLGGPGPLHANDLLTTPQPKREVRGVWLTTLNGLDWPRTKASSASTREAQQAELCQILDRLKAAHINTVFLQTRVRGSLLYPDGTEPQDVALTGRYGGDPGYDALAYAIEEAHARGMELHAWVVSIPCYKTSLVRQMGAKGVARTHPSLLKKHEGMYYLDPGLPGTATYLAGLCEEIVRRYDVDGIHLDYIRYPENASTFPDGPTYRKYGQGKSKSEWRRDNVSRLVGEIYRTVKAVKPWVRVSCAPLGKYRDVSRYSAQGWAAYTTVYQDAQGWLREGVMDMLCPMMYFQGDHFFPFAADWQEASYGRTVVPGLGIYFLSEQEKDWELAVVQRELHFLRQEGLGGQAYFRSQFLTDNTKGLWDYLHSHFYPYPALLPAMTWEEAEALPAPVRGKRERIGGSRERITWDVEKEPAGGLRYVVYASPSPEADTSQASSIVCVTREKHYEYNLLLATLKGLHLSVTALDRFGNESPALNF